MEAYEGRPFSSNQTIAICWRCEIIRQSKFWEHFVKGLLTDFQDINDALRNSFVRVTQAGYEKGNGKRATDRHWYQHWYGFEPTDKILKKMQTLSVEESHVEGTSKKQHLNFQKYICTYKLLMLRRVMVGGIWETPEYLKQNCTSYP